MKVCKTCGAIINEEEALAFVVNSGLDTEYVECEICHDNSWEKNGIIMCEACGEWFTPDVLHSETIGDNTFCPCPVCGKDIVEGISRQEAEEDAFQMQYIVIAHDFRGGSRGYVIFARTESEMMQKLLKKIDMRCVSSLDFASILLEEDVMK